MNTPHHTPSSETSVEKIAGRLPPAPQSEHRCENAVQAGPAIERGRILVVVKMSALQWEQRATGKPLEQLMQQYAEQGASGQRMIISHLRQQQVLEDLAHELKASQIMPVQSLTADVVREAGLLIALGGDDHFKLISHWIDDDKPIVGVNSDPEFSEGNLTSATAADLPGLLRCIERGDYRLEPWTRLRLEIDGQDRGPALGEIVLAKQDFRLMSRHLIEFNGESAIQKSSGMLISTGAGSTGWFSSAGLYLAPEGRPFSRTETKARFELREPHVHFEITERGRRAVLPPLVDGVLEAGQTLVLTSLNNSSGIASRDSIDTIPFERGSVARIQLDPKPLWVVSSDFRSGLSTH